MNDLDDLADGVPASLDLGRQLLDVADAMDAQYLLRRSLSDPHSSVEQRTKLAETLLGGSISPPAMELVKGAAAQSWPSPDALAWAVRDLAVHVAWRSLPATENDTARAQVLELISAVTRDQDLTAALSGAHSLQDRQQLVVALAKGALPQVGLLARSAAGDSRGSFAANLSRSLDKFAAMRGFLRAAVTTAVPLNQTQLATLRTELQRIYRHPVDLESAVDAQVIGGVRVDVQGDVIDGSIKARLDAAREAIAAGTASKEVEHA